MKQIKENWINNECKDIDNSLASNRSKKHIRASFDVEKIKNDTILNNNGKF